MRTMQIWEVTYQVNTFSYQQPYTIHVATESNSFAEAEQVALQVIKEDIENRNKISRIMGGREEFDKISIIAPVHHVYLEIE